MLSDRQTFAGKNWAFTLCSYLFVRSTHGRDILLDPNRLKSQRFSQVSRPQGTRVQQLHQTESLPFSIRVISCFAPGASGFYIATKPTT